MGQYWIPVNLDKKEFVHPHKLGSGLKLWEQLAAHPGTGAALIVLCAAMPERRGGGDLKPDPIIGRWAGDRVVLIGDYAEDGDLKKGRFKASKLYNKCQDNGDYVYNGIAEGASFSDGRPDSPTYGQYAHWKVTKPSEFTDISEDVCRVIERELGGQFSGSGWREWTQAEQA